MVHMDLSDCLGSKFRIEKIESDKTEVLNRCMIVKPYNLGIYSGT